MKSHGLVGSGLFAANRSGLAPSSPEADWVCWIQESLTVRLARVDIVMKLAKPMAVTGLLATNYHSYR
jgi:hypothetical protein